MNNPTVSVIIPNYNHARYLDQRIQSVLNQTYQDFEVIILDDCSTDNSIDIINKYKDNPHISQIMVNEKNSGSTFKQWDKGIQLATGSIIWIAESDDYCEYDFLEKLIPLFSKYNCGIVQSASCLVDSSNQIIPGQRTFNGKEILAHGKDVIRQHFICGCSYIPNASAVLFKRNAATSVSLDYTSYKAAGDRMFWIYMLEYCSICTYGVPLNFFRQHGLNVSSKRELDGSQNLEDYKINCYLRNNGYVNMYDKCNELIYYRRYLRNAVFQNESVRTQLISTWFPGLLKYDMFFKAYVKILSLMCKITGNHK